MSGQAQATAWIEEANGLQNRGHKLKAAPLYIKAAEAFAPFGSFALVAGDSYLEAKMFAAAAHAYWLCLEGAPDHDQALAGLLRAHTALGQREAARPAYERAGQRFPSEARGGFLKRLFGLG